MTDIFHVLTIGKSKFRCQLQSCLEIKLWDAEPLSEKFRLGPNKM